MVAKQLNPKVDHFLKQASKWKEEMTLLREIALEANELKEDYKWMHPCYTLDGKNVVLIHGFKDYCAYLFHKGALMEDPSGILIQQTENVQSARQIRFADLSEIKKQRSLLKDYIREAIAVEKAGLKVKPKKTADFPVPPEFQEKLDTDSALKKAFERLTPGRQRAYLFHFSQAKRRETRQARVEKYTPKILLGKGLHD